MTDWEPGFYARDCEHFEMIDMPAHRDQCQICDEPAEHGLCLPLAWVEVEVAEAAIRSQRVKLHRERARVHKLEARLTAARYASWASERLVRRHEKAAARFSSRADKIERGEL